MRAPNLQILTDQTKRKYPGVVIYGVGDEGHRLSPSDHNEDDTPGSKPEQEDADNIPEHRAIDVMIGPAFTKSQADVYVSDLVNQAENRARLKYVIWNRHIWRRNGGWVREDYTGSNPHTDHAHVSGLAANDEDTKPWSIGDDMALEPTDPSYNDLINRVDGLFRLLSTNAGPSGGTNELKVVLLQIRDLLVTVANRPPVEPAPVDAASLKTALQDPEVFQVLVDAHNAAEDS